MFPDPLEGYFSVLIRSQELNFVSTRLGGVLGGLRPYFLYVDACLMGLYVILSATVELVPLLADFAVDTSQMLGLSAVDSFGDESWLKLLTLHDRLIMGIGGEYHLGADLS
jgi:hypothetical protein